MNPWNRACTLLTRVFKPDDSRVGILLLRNLCEELIADIPPALGEGVTSRLRRVQSDEDVRHLRLAVFDAISHARGQGEAIARIAIFDRRIFLNSAYSLLRC
jgi:hypothetical protein